MTIDRLIKERIPGSRIFGVDEDFYETLVGDTFHSLGTYCKIENNPEIYEKMYSHLISGGFKNPDAEKVAKLFVQKDVILIRMPHLYDDPVVIHELYHREYEKLNDEEHSILKRGAQPLLKFLEKKKKNPFIDVYLGKMRKDSEEQTISELYAMLVYHTDCYEISCVCETLSGFLFAVDEEAYNLHTRTAERAKDWLKMDKPK